MIKEMKIWENEIPLFDVFIYLKDQMKANNIDLSQGDTAE